jgi:hypothetical protein
MLDLITPAENHIMRISQNRSDISGLVWCVAARRARPQIADAVRIASTFDIIGIDPARFTRDIGPRNSNSLRVELDGRSSAPRTFHLMRKSC